MSKALDPLRRLVVQFNARFAHTRAFPNANLPQPAPPHLTAPPPQATASAAAHLTAPLPKPALPYFGHFQARVPVPSYKDGPVLLAHLNRQLNTLARQVFVPEPARVAAVNYACKSAGRPQMASLLAQSSQRMMHHQPLRFASAIPHGFARGVGLSSTRGFCSSVGPAVNGPVRMMAQMYAKPLGSMPAHAQKMSSEKDSTRQPVAKKHRSHKKSGEIKKRTASANRLSPITIKAFLNRAAQVEQQHQILNLCKTNVAPAISTATAISLAKVAGKTESELEALPKLQFSETCPTQVDMCFLLDASPLWHLDTMVAALHTDSLRAPKELNRRFIDDLLEITNAQYQHFLEVSAILQKLVQCPESREITLEGYELRVHFSGTTLFDMIQFLRQLAIDPRSPHFDLEEVYPNHVDMEEQYFPQASVNRYYEPTLSDNETWDDCSSIQSSLMMFTDSERCESAASFTTLESLPEQESPWDGLQPDTVEDIIQDDDDLQEEQQQEQEQESEQDVHVYENIPTTLTASSTDILFPGEESVSPWTNAPVASSIMIQESTENLNKLSSRILNASTVVNQEYFDDIRGFLDNLEAVHRHSERLFGSSTITA